MKIVVTLEIECTPDQGKDFEDVEGDMKAWFTAHSWLPHEGEVTECSTVQRKG